MLFSKNKNIIYISGSKVISASVDFRLGQPIVEGKLQNDFDWQALPNLLQQIKGQLKPAAFRVILPSSKTYLILLKFPKGTNLDKNLVLRKAQESIPEIVDERFMDWKTISENEKEIKVQVLVANKEFFDAFLMAAAQAKMPIEAYEPVSFCLARLTKNEKEPQLIIYQESAYVLLIAAFQGQVFETITVMDQKVIEDKIKEFSFFVLEKWGISLKKTINQPLDPIVGLALKDDLKGSDEKVLNLAPPEIRQAVVNKNA